MYLLFTYLSRELRAEVETLKKMLTNCLTIIYSLITIYLFAYLSTFLTIYQPVIQLNYLSRELRAEVEALKEMLIHAAQPAVLKEKLNENEKLMEVSNDYIF